MLKAYQRTNECVAPMGDASTTSAKRKRIKIINGTHNDFFEQLHSKEKITADDWQLITDIRRLALCARRSQGIRIHLQSHSQNWGMPLVFGEDGYVKAYAERRWKLFLNFLKPFLDHQWLDTKLTELLVFGGRIFCEDQVMKRKPRSDFDYLGIGIDHVRQALLIVRYAYEKTYRKR